MTPIFQQKKLRIKATLKYVVILVLVLLVTIFQDYLHSRYNKYSFYASESFLFNIFWILILPVALIFNVVFTKISALAKIRELLVKRLLFVLAASIFHILVFAVSVHLISAIFYTHTFTFEDNLGYTVSHDFYKYLLIYSIVSLVLIKKRKSQDPLPHLIDQVIIGSGRKITSIRTSDIFYITAASPYIAIHTADKKELHSDSLKAILEKLDPDTFVRIHKSTIVNLHKIVSYTSRLNGDYDVRLSNQKDLRLSRNYVETFKRKFARRSSS